MSTQNIRKRPCTPALTVFYDGQCPVCSREIALYGHLDRRRRIDWVDIHGAAFTGSPQRPDRDTALALLHARQADGRMRVGVDALVAVWQTLPLTRPLAWLARRPVLRRLLERGYHLFLRWRARREPCPADGRSSSGPPAASQ